MVPQWFMIAPELVQFGCIISYLHGWISNELPQGSAITTLSKCRDIQRDLVSHFEWWCLIVRQATRNDPHYGDVIMSVVTSQIIGVSMVCSTVCSSAEQRKHQSSASLAFVRGIHRWPVNFPHKGPVTRKIFPFDDVFMKITDNPRHSEENMTNFFQYKLWHIHAYGMPTVGARASADTPMTWWFEDLYKHIQRNENA